MKIAPVEWVQLTQLRISPSNIDNESTFFGLISGVEDQNQYEVRITLGAEDQILIRDLYINKTDFIKLSPEIESIIILDDGRHQFVTGRQIERKRYVMQDLPDKKRYISQINLF